MKNAVKLRCYPDEATKHFFEKCFNRRRFGYNFFLNRQFQKWGGKKPNAVEQEPVTFVEVSKYINDLKIDNEDYVWLDQEVVPSSVMTNALKDAEQAFDNAFNPDMPDHAMPRHRAKRLRSGTFRVQVDSRRADTIFNGQQKLCVLPTFGDIGHLIKWPKRPINGVAKNITITLRPSGQYYMSVSLDKAEFEQPVRTHGTVGVDVGITTTVQLSNGIKFNLPFDKIERMHERVKKLQRKIAKCKMGSKRCEVLLLRKAKIESAIVKLRNDWLHKIAHAIVQQYDVICVESLDIKSMLMQNKRTLSRLIARASWGHFLSFLEYKCARAGKQFVKVDQFFPSSQTCSECGAITKHQAVYDTHKCHKCNHVMDRDLNAAINIAGRGFGSLGRSSSDDLNFNRTREIHESRAKPVRTIDLSDEVPIQKLSPFMKKAVQDALAL